MKPLRSISARTSSRTESPASCCASHHSRTDSSAFGIEIRFRSDVSSVGRFSTICFPMSRSSVESLFDRLTALQRRHATARDHPRDSLRQTNKPYRRCGACREARRAIFTRGFSIQVARVASQWDLKDEDRPGQRSDSHRRGGLEVCRLANGWACFSPVRALLRWRAPRNHSGDVRCSRSR